MRGRETAATRIQVYLTDPRVVAALQREARAANIPISQAAGRSLAKGLARSLPADPDDRLLQLDRALRDHMRSTARDVQIIQELVIEVARAFFMRLPDAITDQDPVARAAVDRRIERLLDDTAARLISGVRPQREDITAGSLGRAE
ncbi:MAG: hypothetical protein DI531_09610 [Brevundimonas sp.]|jgi:hypothetical protein|uniref:hypothetical protein n=1 Tax=Brevundimonas TaxID=41275 RepID=UPI000DB4B610|nr:MULTISPECIES: hypothetical protein [Brevundimonas]MBC1183258.1 hypothetical protein [Brevundimonas huaxiensis]PZU73795.1 MAG: hypothetical protein DI531_09610 [Brevundimonas sp.]